MDLKERRLFFSFCNLLANVSHSQRKCLIETVTLQQVKGLHELAFNIIVNDSIGVENFDESRKKVLDKNLDALKRLASKTVSLSEKRDVVIKHGDLLKTLCEIGADFLADHIGGT
jgi:uncharacterized Rmd1/YagE family protein